MVQLDVYQFQTANIKGKKIHKLINLDLLQQSIINNVKEKSFKTILLI